MVVTARPPGYELFFAPLQAVYDPNTLERVNFAYIASKFGHAKQTRESGERYFDHPKSVAWIYIDELKGRDSRIIIDALLHDLSEDTYLLSPYRISLNFDEQIALDVRALTKLPKGKETTDQYLARIIARGPEVVLVKLCDRLHNLRTLGVCSNEKKQHQIEETEIYHLAILIPALRSAGENWTEYADHLEAKIREAMAQIQRSL